MLDISIKSDTRETRRCHKGCCEKQWTRRDESVHVHTLTVSNENLQTWAIAGLSGIWEFVAAHAMPDRGYLGLRALKKEQAL